MTFSIKNRSVETLGSHLNSTHSGNISGNVGIFVLLEWLLVWLILFLSKQVFVKSGVKSEVFNANEISIHEGSTLHCTKDGWTLPILTQMWTSLSPNKTEAKWLISQAILKGSKHPSQPSPYLFASSIATAGRRKILYLLPPSPLSGNPLYGIRTGRAVVPGSWSVFNGFCQCPFGPDELKSISWQHRGRMNEGGKLPFSSVSRT